LALALFVLFGGPAFLIPNHVLSETIITDSTQRTTLLNENLTRHDDITKSYMSFRPVESYDRVRGPRNDWDLRYGGLNFNGDRDWLMVREGSRIRDLGNIGWSNDIAVPVLPLLPCPTRERCTGVRIPPSSSGKKIQDEDVNPQIAKPVAGHMYLVHSYHGERDLSDPREFDTLLDYYTLFRVEELKRNESLTITWKRIPAPK